MPRLMRKEVFSFYIFTYAEEINNQLVPVCQMIKNPVKRSSESKLYVLNAYLKKVTKENYANKIICRRSFFQRSRFILQKFKN